MSGSIAAPLYGALWFGVQRDALRPHDFAGSAVRATVRFALDEEFLLPATVTGVVFSWIDPDDVTLRVSGVADGLGQWASIRTTKLHGAWQIRVTCDQPLRKAIEKTIDIQSSDFPDDDTPAALVIVTTPDGPAVVITSNGDLAGA